jgi:hypothetical protein
MYEDPKSKISQLEKVLDAREDKVTKRIKRHELHDRESNIPEDWDDAVTQSPVRNVGLEVDANPGFAGASLSQMTETKKGMSLAVKILIGSIIFFVLALGVVLYKFFIGGNVVSGDNIAITVKAPVSVASGEALSFEIEVKNNNSTALLAADLNVAFPAGVVSAADLTTVVKRNQLFLGDILPGQTVKKNLKVVLFGSENEKKNLSMTLEYKVAGSNSLFNKLKTVSVLITSAPVTLVVSGPTEINANQAVNLSVEVTSNSTSVIKNLLLKATYPFGFTFNGSSPNPFTKNDTWLIGDLAPGEKRTIKISGMVSGQEGEERGFNFSLGSQSASDTSLIDTPFNSSFSSVTIRRPFVSADISLNGDESAEYVTGAGDKIEAIVRWKNNLPYKVSDVSIVIKMSGNALDKSAVQVDGGFYRSLDNTIIFDKTTDRTLASLEPGQSGESQFILRSFGASSVTGSGLSNPVISMAITVGGKTINSNTSAQNILFADSRKIKVTSNPQLSAKALYYVGPFSNKGPIPPRAEVETTYTVTWTVTNPLNNLTGARVTAILPPYVKWLDTVSPSLEKISYDAGTRQITWAVGNVSAGAGTVSSAREVSFQVSLVPSVSQIGETPNIINESTLSARDVFAGATVSDIFQAVSTELTGDPYFRIDSSAVVK